MKVKCVVCEKWEHLKKMNVIYRKRGPAYYCKKKLCQEQFIKDAGDRPD